MSTILLDIDGVLVSDPSWRRQELLADGFSIFNTKASASLSKILSHTKAAVIITSSHRHRYSAEDWLDVFKRRGIIVSSLAVLDCPAENNRKLEIESWLSGPHDEYYVIIDDDKSLNELSEPNKRRLVLTSSLIGLTDEGANEAMFILSND